MQQILIDSIPLNKRQYLDTVHKINNTLRWHEPVYCTMDGNGTHQITLSRHRGLTFQVQIAGYWHDASPKNVWKVKGTRSKTATDLASPTTLSQRECVSLAMNLLRQRTYHAVLSAGPTWPKAFRRAQQWSSIDRAGILFSTDESLQLSFDEHGHLINPLTCVWQGDFALIAACFRGYGFAVTHTESPDPRWSELAISPLSQEREART